MYKENESKRVVQACNKKFKEPTKEISRRHTTI